MSTPASQGNAQGTALPHARRVETPGDPARPASFLAIKEDEIKLAGYLGFAHSSGVRQVCLTWPVITAFLEFEVFADGIRQSILLSLAHQLRAEEEVILAMSCQEYPTYVQGFLAFAGEKYNYETLWGLWIVLRLERDLAVYANTDEATNLSQNEVALQDLANTLGRPVPARSVGAPIPTLGPLPGEHRLESLNRCYTLLRWMTYADHRRDERRIWTSKFGSEGAVLSGRYVRPAKIPAWMRPTG